MFRFVNNYFYIIELEQKIWYFVANHNIHYTSLRSANYTMNYFDDFVFFSLSQSQRSKVKNWELFIIIRSDVKWLIIWIGNGWYGLKHRIYWLQKLILLASVSIGGLVFAACCVIPSQYVNIGVSSLSRIIQWINYTLFGIWLDGQILIDF